MVKNCSSIIGCCLLQKGFITISTMRGLTYVALIVGSNSISALLGLLTLLLTQ